MNRFLIPCILLAALLPGGCRESGAPEPVASGSGSLSSAPVDPPFEDVTAAAGIRFRHENGGRSPLNILQTAGSGCAFLDFDRDGWLDLFLVNGSFLDRRPVERQPRHALYHNNGDGTFADVTERA